MPLKKNTDNKEMTAQDIMDAIKKAPKGNDDKETNDNVAKALGADPSKPDDVTATMAEARKKLNDEKDALKKATPPIPDDDPKLQELDNALEAVNKVSPEPKNDKENPKPKRDPLRSTKVQSSLAGAFMEVLENGIGERIADKKLGEWKKGIQESKVYKAVEAYVEKGIDILGDKVKGTPMTPITDTTSPKPKPEALDMAAPTTGSAAPTTTPGSDPDPEEDDNSHITSL